MCLIFFAEGQSRIEGYAVVQRKELQTVSSNLEKLLQ